MRQRAFAERQKRTSIVACCMLRVVAGCISSSCPGEYATRRHARTSMLVAPMSDVLSSSSMTNARGKDEERPYEKRNGDLWGLVPLSALSALCADKDVEYRCESGPL